MCSDAATVTANSLMTCPDACYQAPRSRVPSVVVLDVANSNPIAHPQYSRTSGDPRCPLRRVFGVSDVRFWERTVRFLGVAP